MGSSKNLCPEHDLAISSDRRPPIPLGSKVFTGSSSLWGFIEPRRLKTAGSAAARPPRRQGQRLIVVITVITVMITGLLASCEKQQSIRSSSTGLIYEDVKNNAYNPPYLKFPIDFATQIYISAANADTNDYISPRFTDTDIPDPSNTTNYIKDITIDAIQWTGGIGPVAQYATVPKRDSITTFRLKATDAYDLVDINTGFRVTDSLIQFQINPLNDNNEIFECYNDYGSMYSQVYQQKTGSYSALGNPRKVPAVYIWNTWKFKDLRLLGKIINAVVKKATDTTITYYRKY